MTENKDPLADVSFDYPLYNDPLRGPPQSMGTIATRRYQYRKKAGLVGTAKPGRKPGTKLKEGEFVQVQLYLSDSKERVVNAYCRAHGITMSQFLDGVVEKAVERAENLVAGFGLNRRGERRY